MYSKSGSGSNTTILRVTGARQVLVQQQSSRDLLLVPSTSWREQEKDTSVPTVQPILSSKKQLATERFEIEETKRLSTAFSVITAIRKLVQDY